MRVHKKVIAMHSGDWLPCCWDDCEKPGYELYKARVNEASPGQPPNLIQYVFCSERHKLYWVTGHKHYGNLPAGSRNII